MKKLFAIVAVAATLAACNGTGEDKPASDTTKKETTTPATDAAKTADTAKKMADTAMNKMQKMADTAKKAMENAADKMKDASKMVDKAKDAMKKN